MYKFNCCVRAIHVLDGIWRHTKQQVPNLRGDTMVSVTFRFHMNRCYYFPLRPQKIVMNELTFQAFRFEWTQSVEMIGHQKKCEWMGWGWRNSSKMICLKVTTQQSGKGGYRDRYQIQNAVQYLTKLTMRFHQLRRWLIRADGMQPIWQRW